MPTRFKFRKNLPELPKGAERAIVEQFQAIEAAINEVQGVQRNATPVLNVPTYMAKPGELVLLEGNAGGTLLTIPPGSPFNIEQTIRVALVRGVLSPGVTISIVGRKGTINGAATLVMTTRGIVELTSVGENGWVSAGAGGGGAVVDGVYGSITVSGGGTIWRVTDGVYGDVTVSGGGLTWTVAGGAAAMTDTAVVVDAAIGAASNVGIFWGDVLDTDVNSPEADAVTFTCIPAAGSMTVRVSSDKSPVGGPYKLRYLIG